MVVQQSRSTLFQSSKEEKAAPSIHIVILVLDVLVGMTLEGAPLSILRNEFQRLSHFYLYENESKLAEQLGAYHALQWSST